MIAAARIFNRLRDIAPAGRVRDVRDQLAVYKRFRKLVDEWVHLAIEHAQLKLELSREAPE